jgi:carbamoyl-phosphate synthase large subunit
MNVLLCSVGYRSYLINYFRNALVGIGKVYAGDYTPLSPALYCADQVIRLRKEIDKAYAMDILKQCQEYKIGLVVPLSDYELPVLSNYVREFRDKGVLLMLSDAEVIGLCRDKWATYQHLLAHDVPVPHTVPGIDEAVQSIQNGKLSWPLLIKPRGGSAGRGIHKVRNKKELRTFFGPNCIVQQWLGWQEYGLDVLTDTTGTSLTVVPRFKIAMRAGETDKAFSVAEPILVELGVQIAKVLAPLGLRGPFDVDLLWDGKSAPRVLEINPRFGGGYPVAHLSGAKFPEKMIALARGEKVEANWGTFQPGGKVMLKHLGVLALPNDQIPKAWGADYIANVKKEGAL